MRKILLLALIAPALLSAAYTCQNADGGNNPLAYGECTDVNGPHQEYCADSKTLVEYYCPTEGAWGVVCQKEEVVCSGLCGNGECVDAPKEVAPTQNPALPKEGGELTAPPAAPALPKEEEKPPVDTDYIKFVLFGLIVFAAVAYLGSAWLEGRNKKKKKASRKKKKGKNRK